MLGTLYTKICVVYVVINTVYLNVFFCRVTAGVGGYPQQEHIQPMLPAWVYNDSLVPGKHFHKMVSSLRYLLKTLGLD